MARKNKGHYRDEEWVDYANENVPAEKRQAMSEHLSTRCQPCAKAVKTWSHVREAAKREATYEAPGSAVQHVRNVFRLVAGEKKQRRLGDLPRLVFDSLWQPAMAGVRSSASTARQVLYRTKDVTIEMRIEPEQLSESLNVIGQISSVQSHGEGIPEVGVVVGGKANVIAEARTNRFGEFQCSFVPEEGLYIQFAVSEGKTLSIPLDSGAARQYRQN
jgi:hypothetical protein